MRTARFASRECGAELTRGSSLSQDGAIAQLGERVLCKHEVVGSIPSGSTRWFDRRTKPQSSSLKEIKFRCEHLRCFGGLSNIVKRKHIRSWSGSVRSLDGSDLLVMWAPLDRSALGCVRSKNGLFKRLPVLFSKGRATEVSSAEGRTRWASIMRAIKCHKGIRWMPWRSEAMKDVVRCDKSWGAANEL